MGRYILIGAVIGSILSWVMNISIVTGLVLGAFVAAICYTIYSKRNIAEGTNDSLEQTIQLREEQVDIKKERVQTGEIKIHKEIVEEEKTITVPIRREEMVIEAGSEEELRIPLKEEEIEINKHPVQVAEVSVTKHQVEETEQVKATVKKETLSYETEGNADVKEEQEQSL
ncbi:YsnF/AvaK domain-containing protein [Alkalihalobacillus deserti]|uniref:YsnF/AvaK domain-containing protein n=1 Tax=Alkalihalobacillus deserti TaxID=2879466 RepID=UPI001D134554|nr:YsnF/AvaK domain-containing protein [Alkalihalobacillus deserti]